MKHFSEAAWLAFKHRKINSRDAETMETHLLECEQCMNLFLELTDELESARIDTIIPPDFVRLTMSFIAKDQASQPKAVRNREKTKRLLSYYVGAAAVTLMMVSGGVFQAAVDISPTTHVNREVNSETTNNIIFSWPNRLIETSSSWTRLLPEEGQYLRRFSGE